MAFIAALFAALLPLIHIWAIISAVKKGHASSIITDMNYIVLKTFLKNIHVIAYLIMNLLSIAASFPI